MAENYTAFPVTFDASFGDGHPKSTEVTPTEAMVELLDGAGDFGAWTNENPEVFKWWDKSQKERGPGDGQPPELHVWQPTGAGLERLTADNVLLEETPTIEIYVFSLDETETAQYARDLISYLSSFMSDKEQNTPFADIVPTNVEDFREQKLRQVTDHFVYMVECEITHLQDTEA